MQKRGKAKLLVIATLVFIGLFSVGVLSQRLITGEVGETPTGKFSVADNPPLRPTEFAVQDFNSTISDAQNWDGGTPSQAAAHDSIDGSVGINDTHDNTPTLRWKVSDPNNNNVFTYLCIAKNVSEAQNGTCIYNVTTPSIASNTLANHIVITPLEYSGPTITYWVNLTPSDSKNGPALIISFNLNNTAPFVSPTIGVENEGTLSYVAEETHDPKPDISWNITDLDDGIKVDKWPDDNPLIKHYIQVGTGVGFDHTYLYNANLSGISILRNSSGSVKSANWTQPIPWGTTEAPLGRTNQDAFVSINGTEHNNSWSTYLNRRITLVDFLPLVADESGNGVDLKDNDLAAPSTCKQSTSTCTIRATPATVFNGSNGLTGINASIKFSDLDDDCNNINGNHNVTLYLCTSNQSLDICTRFNSVYNYTLNYALGTGDPVTPCVFHISTKDGSPRNPEFFLPPNSKYELHVDANSQSRINRTPPNITVNQVVNLTWEYVGSQAINYYDLNPKLPDGITNNPNYQKESATVFVGPAGSVSVDNWNSGVRVYEAINQANIARFARWNTTAFCHTSLINVPLGFCRGENGTDTQVWEIREEGIDDFQIDDDILQGEITETGLLPVTFNVPDALGNYKFPATTLSLCTNFVCTTTASRINTSYHIRPRGGLDAGDFVSQITLINSAT